MKKIIGVIGSDGLLPEKVTAIAEKIGVKSRNAVLSLCAAAAAA